MSWSPGREEYLAARQFILRNESKSHGAAGGGAGGPGPLEIESAKMSGDVHNFADKIQAGNFAAFHCFAGKFVGVNSSAGDFRFFVAFCSRRSDFPFVRAMFKIGEVFVRPGLRSVQFQPARGHAAGKKFVKCGASDGDIAHVGIADGFGGVVTGREIDADGFAGIPVGRNLQDGGAAESAMGDEHFFAEGLFFCGGDDFGGEAGEVTIVGLIFCGEDEWDQRGLWLDDFQIELAGEIVA